MLLYVSGLGSSPARIIKELKAIEQAVTRSGVSYSRIIAKSPSYIDSQISWLSNFTQVNYDYFVSNNVPGFSRLQIYKIYQMIFDGAATTATLPSNLPTIRYSTMIASIASQKYLQFLYSPNQINFDIYANYIRIQIM